MQNPVKIFEKGRLRFGYAGLEDGKLKKAACSELERLLDKNAASNRTLRKHLVNAILPAVAIYRVALRHGYQKSEAFRLVRGSILKSVEPMADSVQRLSKLPGFFSLFGLMCELSTKTAFNIGWDMRWNKSDKGVISWDCHRCFYTDTLKKLNAPELCKIFCESDDVIYGRIPGVRWGRRKTIGRGGEICDFRFYREKTR